jgi:transcriptional regulator with GAF, ATPase, and Fis domain/tetratricopeptide (TPR) repeat protein
MDARRDTPTRPEPDHAEWERLVQLGDLHRAADNTADALCHYERAREPLGAPTRVDPRGVRVSLRLADCLLVRGELARARAAMVEAEVFAGPHPDPSTRARFTALRALLTSMAGDYDAARTSCRAALELLREGQDPDDVPLMGRLYLALGHVLERKGDTAGARSAFERALQVYESINDRRGVAHAYNNLALNRKQEGRFREAVSLLHRALAILDEVGDYGRKAPTCLNLGILHTRLGEWREARVQLQRATQIAREIDHRGRLAKSLLARGVLEMRCREFPAARETLAEARKLALTERFAREAILAREFEGELLITVGKAGDGVEVLERALVEAEALAPSGDLVPEILRRLAEGYLTLGRDDEAHAAASRAIETAERLGDHTEAAAARRIVGLVRIRSGDPEGGMAAVETAVSLLNDVGALFEVARTHLVLARELVAGAGTSPSPIITAHLAHAREGFETLGVPGYLADVLLVAADDHIRFHSFDEAENLLRAAGRYVDASDESDLLEHHLRLRAKLDTHAHRELEETDELVSPSRELHRMFRSGVDLESALDTLLSIVLRRTSSDRAVLARGPDPHGLTVVAAKGVNTHDALGLLDEIGPVVRHGLATGLPALRPGDDSPSGDLSGFAVAPLCLPHDIWGILYLDRRRTNVVGAYRQGDLKLLSLLAELASISVLALDRSRILSERADGAARPESPGRFSRPILYRSEKMAEVMDTVEKVADSPASVLIRGETGTGKGLVARAIHEAGSRRERRFVQINCAALPEQLLESELFGHVSGAFTGATRTRRGLLEEAEGGTVFLDEVDKTSRAVQAKLLHVLDHREIRAVGANQWKRVDARILSATNADLREMIEGGSFLEDLYYRLNDISIHLPPLRERPDDVDLLVESFVRGFATEMGRSTPTLAPEVIRALRAYRWPGNVRELEKVVRRVLVLTEEGTVVGPRRLPPEVVGATASDPSEGLSLKAAVRSLERRLIADALAECGHNKSEVVRRLGISYPTLLARIRAYGLERRSGDSPGSVSRRVSKVSS